MENQFRYDTYCGLYCGACPILGANDRRDQDWIEATAKQWNKDPEDLRCLGCKTEVTAAFCTNCGMRKCARDRGLEFCSECTDYPCEQITAFRNDAAPHHSVVFTNLVAIKEKGVDAWLAEQKSRWSCSECGTDLYNAVKEEKYLGN